LEETTMYRTSLLSLAAALVLCASSLTACGGEQEVDDTHSAFPVDDGADGSDEPTNDDHTYTCRVNADCPDGYVCQGELCCPNVDLDLPPPPEVPPPVRRPDPEAPGTCAQGDLSYASEPPTVMVVVDQSGSMTERLDSGEVRWEAIRAALTDPSTSIVAALENEVRFGLSLYTWSGSGACPAMTDVAVSFGNFQAIADELNRAEPQQHTPTAEALETVTATLLGMSSSEPKAIILATDGDPDYCGDKDSNGEAYPRELTIAAIEAARAHGIETYVIDVGDEDSHLQEMADAGAGLDPAGDDHAALYQPTSSADLRDHLEEIVWGVRACTFSLDNPVEAAQLDGAIVTFDGAEVPMDAANGWRLNGSQEVQLVGSFCDAVAKGDHEVTAAFPCVDVEGVY
jgi:hypothetical protein